tara:strand:- start:503 stop:1093 length:591 start_codon:yes stop_codon:yes gene_type:complete
MLWTTDIETILNDLRENSVYLSQHHKKRYFYYKQVSTYFRVPTIILSSVASVASVGLTAYVEQENISGIVCLMSLTIGIINSIELYLRIQDNLENELETSKKYYNLSIDLHKILNLSQQNREGEPKKVLDTFYQRYIDLVAESNLLSISYPDKLSKVPKMKSIFERTDKKLTSSPTGSSTSSLNSNPLDDSPDAVL